jgi:hypothetical protein
VIKLNGRRGAFLLLFGLMFICIGYALSIPMPSASASQFLHDLLPWWARTALWAGSGVIAVIAGFVRRPKFTIAGYTFLSLPPAERLASYALSWIIIDVDYRLAVLGSVVYGSLLIAILIVASWPEPNPINIKSILPPDKRDWKRRWR